MAESFKPTGVSAPINIVKTRVYYLDKLYQLIIYASVIESVLSLSSNDYRGWVSTILRINW